jgi:hypothetical protein
MYHRIPKAMTRVLACLDGDFENELKRYGGQKALTEAWTTNLRSHLKDETVVVLWADIAAGSCWVDIAAESVTKDSLATKEKLCDLPVKQLVCCLPATYSA